jgi:D-alanyl-D-alanine carboxypeptidase
MSRMNMTRFATLIALAAAVVPACSAQSPELPGAPDPAVLDEFQAALRDWASDPGHYGVSAAVIFPNGAEWAGVGGVAGADEPLRPEDLIWIASITKTMTGAVILQLVEEGSLGLDDRIGDWLDPIEHVNPDITIRQLLNHTNGLFNYTWSSPLSPVVTADPSHVFSATELLDYLEPPAFSPGEKTQYTNTSFVLLGLIAEAATGAPIMDLWETRLWSPQGLDEIFLPGFQDPPGPVANAWMGRPPATETVPLDRMSLLSLGNSAWGLFSNARTVARWGRALFAGNVVGDAMRHEMTRLVPAAGNIPGESGVGLGIRSYEYLGREQLGHSGGSALGSSLLLYDPTTGITVAVIMNQGAGAAHFQLAPRLLALAAGDP